MQFLLICQRDQMNYALLYRSPIQQGQEVELSVSDGELTSSRLKGRQKEEFLITTMRMYLFSVMPIRSYLLEETNTGLRPTINSGRSKSWGRAGRFCMEMAKHGYWDKQMPVGRWKELKSLPGISMKRSTRQEIASSINIRGIVISFTS